MMEANTKVLTNHRIVSAGGDSGHLDKDESSSKGETGSKRVVFNSE